VSRLRGGGPIAAAALLLLLALAACRGERRLAFPRVPVVVISIDTLRADRLPAYGYRGVETPHIDALARDAVLFENAYSHVPLTLPAHVSLFTGLLPPSSGVRDNLGYRLAPGVPTLAAFLSEKGWAAGGAVSCAVLARETGVARGFGFYSDDLEAGSAGESSGRVQRDGAETVQRLESWIDSAGGKPLFAFLHIFEPHSPYEPPEPYRTRYRSPYDGEVARADEVVGAFLGFLKERGFYEKSIVVLLSDHGEGLNDHGEEEHGVFLYREAIRVPLIVKLPGSVRAGARVADAVGLTDVFPTVANLLRLPVPKGLSGVSLVPALSGQPLPPRRIYSETLYPRLHLGWSDLASLADERRHYIHAPRPELYDLLADPAERRDLSRTLSADFRALSAELSRMERPLQSPGESVPEQVRKLAALGYLSAALADLSGNDLPDPKDRVAALEKIKSGFGDLQAGRYAPAAAAFRALLAENPRMTDVWQALAEAALKMGLAKEAHAALEEAARLSPGNPQVFLGLSEYFLETGNLTEARRHAQLARDGGAPNGHLQLARVALAEGDLGTAEAEARAAVAKRGGWLPRLLLGRVLYERGAFAAALEVLEQARGKAAGSSPARGVNFLRGDVLARLGRAREAEAAFLEEIARYPDAVPARASLALLHASEGRSAEARRALDALAAMGTPEALAAAGKIYEILGDKNAAATLRAQQRRSSRGSSAATLRQEQSDRGQGDR